MFNRSFPQKDLLDMGFSLKCSENTQIPHENFYSVKTNNFNKSLDKNSQVMKPIIPLRTITKLI